MMVIHGGELDVMVRHAKWLAFLGDSTYATTLSLSMQISARRRPGLPYWSLSAWPKLKMKNAVSFIDRYEARLAAARRGVDGVICGHIHSAALRDIGGLAHVNTGDWVESCTAVVEHDGGRMEIIHWPAFSRMLTGGRVVTLPPAPALAACRCGF